ncbi:MAG: heme-binding protein [Planctomycetota bacterium]
MHRRNRIKKAAIAVAAALAALIAITLPGCFTLSGGTWAFKSASTPERWPELTPIGEVVIREYPAYRHAIIRRNGLADGDAGTSSMFRSLFGHISSHDIAMTAPVDMEYGAGSPDAGMASMAFLYRTRELGATGTDGAVVVEDVEAMTFASVGVRGDYSDDNYAEGLAILNAWAASQSEWKMIGEPRYLGYNGPFTPRFWRYGEVQVPVSLRGR